MEADTSENPVIPKDPRTSTLPVNWCVSSEVSPNLVEPLEYITEAVSYVVVKYVIEAVPCTIILSVNVFTPDIDWLPDVLTVVSSSVVTLVENEPLSVCKADMSETLVAISTAKLELKFVSAN